MKKLPIILLMIYGINTGAQTIQNKEFNNVIEIDDRNIAQIGNNFLVDIPLKENPDSTYVFYLNAKIPVQLFKENTGFYPRINQFILIVPDWQYYNDVAESIKGTNTSCAEPMESNIYYNIKRDGNGIKVDSILIRGSDQPTINSSQTYTSFKDTLIVYRSEQYGSICCPEDPRWQISGEDIHFMKDFEERYKVHITGTFRSNKGKEGEYINYYTLQLLNTQQRLQFIREKRAQWVVNREAKKMGWEPQIFTPQLIPLIKDGFTKMTNIDYELKEIEQVYPYIKKQ